ncbi:NACHT domain-containing protein [Serratia marcescens]|uniref:NACHT domain-containing protein n=1 Tax=Serratia marcescens TaxID=615 RepID=UPI0018D4189B|nr:NACHT domain-containing protein [Serratia marcescens]
MMISSALLGGVFKQLGAKSVDFGLDSVKAKANSLISSFKNGKMLDDYLERAVHKVFVFRTITKGERDVYLDEVYHPVKIKRINSSKEEGVSVVDDGFTINSDGCSAIIGLAGQGKTTMMRKLYLEELIKKDRIPFFITMRQFEYIGKVKCEEILLEHLNSNGIKCDLNDIVELLRTGNVVFYFDGFDEVRFSERNNALKMIISIYNKYGCSSVVTTRPETEITREPGVELYEVERLDKGDVEAIIKRIVGNDETSKALISSLNSNNFLQKTISTPILIDVLIVTSALLSDKPNSICDYYDHLFTALMHRHDLSKNYTREKKSSVNNRELEDVFSFFSFFSYIESKSDFTSELMHVYFEKACRVKKTTGNSANVCSDILDGTNLIVRDGYNNYVYIHRSIQEYFAAKCISSFTNEQKDNFFRKYTNIIQKDGYANLLALYRLIDPVSFYRYHLIPFLSGYGINYDNGFTPLNKSELSKIVDNWVVGVEDGDGDVKGYSSDKSFYRMALSRPGDEKNKSLYSCLYSAVSLCGIDFKSSDYSRYLMIDCSKKIANFVFLPENESKKIHLDGVKIRMNRSYTWMKLGDVKEIVPNYEKKVLNLVYSEYLSMLSGIRDVVENEYTRRVDSEAEITNVLKDMGL